MAKYFFQAQPSRAAALQLYYEQVLTAVKGRDRRLMTQKDTQRLAQQLQDLSKSITDGINERRRRLFGKLNYDHPAKPAPKAGWARRSDTVFDLLFDGLPVGLAIKVEEDDKTTEQQ